MKSKSVLFASIAMVIAGVSSVAGATEACQHNLQVDSVSGQTLTIAGVEQAYTVDTTAENLQGWGKGNELRLCGDQLTNISFQTLPTYKVTQTKTTEPVVEGAVATETVTEQPTSLGDVAEQVTETVLQEAQTPEPATK